LAGSGGERKMSAVCGIEGGREAERDVGVQLQGRAVAAAHRVAPLDQAPRGLGGGRDPAPLRLPPESSVPSRMRRRSGACPANADIGPCGRHLVQSGAADIRPQTLTVGVVGRRPAADLRQMSVGRRPASPGHWSGASSSSRFCSEPGPDPGPGLGSDERQHQEDQGDRRPEIEQDEMDGLFEEDQWPRSHRLTGDEPDRDPVQEREACVSARHGRHRRASGPAARDDWPYTTARAPARGLGHPAANRTCGWVEFEALAPISMTSGADPPLTFDRRLSGCEGAPQGGRRADPADKRVHRKPGPGPAGRSGPSG
jgi:hypothetical protein